MAEKPEYGVGNETLYPHLGRQVLEKSRLPGEAELAGDAGLLKFQQAAVYRLKASGKSIGCRCQIVSHLDEGTHDNEIRFDRSITI